MKKFLSLLLALSMVLALVACNGGNNNSKGSNDQNDSQQNEQQTPEDDNTNTGTETRPNRLIYGTTTQMNGDMAVAAWYSNNAADALLRGLFHDYYTVQMDRDGVYVRNDSVCESIDITENEDGTKTYVEKIREGLTWNNGEPLTAADFAAYILVYNSPANVELGSYAYPEDIVGGLDYYNGDVNYISGVRLLDENTISITVTPEYAHYYHELLYGQFGPIYLPNYTSADITVKDDGEGVYLDGGELVKEELDAARYNYDHPVTAGPYILTSLDVGSYTATLEINPYYAGNYEGQKPSIEQLVVKYTASNTQFDDLTTGGVDLLDQLAEGAEIDKGLDLVEQGGYDYIDFTRAGYGMIQFVCDGGPTQFQAVRHAIAYLLDRNEFANTFTGGYGTVVDGPYGDAFWMYQESKELFASTLNHYNYSPETAVQLLVEDGWVLNADGTEYSGTGTRYKEVTPEEAGDYDLNVTLADGRILMPLHIKWCSSEGNSVSDLLATMLAEGSQVADAGMVITQEIVTFNELLNWMYRSADVDPRYGTFNYGMYNLGSSIYVQYDYAHSYASDPNSTYVQQGWNTNFVFDEELDRLSVDMMYGITPGDEDAYLDYWQQFIVRWNEVLPDLPLYSNNYHTIFRDWLKGYDADAFWTFQYAVLYASIEGAE